MSLNHRTNLGALEFIVVPSQLITKGTRIDVIEIYKKIHRSEKVECKMHVIVDHSNRSISTIIDGSVTA